ncbi:sugar phosphate isomerase/epimerase [Paenibacillus thalictri]|uniref:Sugar phosphate isomerase/epimerase n=2 Tax=Paenibacillus thalictri TaxID=2527873 RepID=A0A4V6MSE0_9BACL|nr:sugar phosphate isomerase/epimerase [Paenibacillus thalictri]
MKLSFTTLGCPDWPLQKIIDNAAEYGFDAIDFRGLQGELDIYNMPEFTVNIADTKSRIEAAGLHVSCFSSSVNLVSVEKFAHNLEEVRQYAKLCAFFGAKYIRVFGGRIGEMDREAAVDVMVKHFGELADAAREHGAKILLETHDDWIACGDVKTVMERTNNEGAGVLWDLHHPYRMLGEQPEHTWNELKPWIEYTHVKDSRITNAAANEFQYCLCGEGDVPLEQTVALLRQNGYDGYFTLEWEKKWHPYLQDAEIVFPHYVQYMRNLEK